MRLAYLGVEPDSAHRFELSGQRGPAVQIVTSTWPGTTEGLREVVIGAAGITGVPRDLPGRPWRRPRN